MFNLEKAINGWRSQLRRNRLGEADIAELESHLRDCIDELSLPPLGTEEAFLAASARLGYADHLADEFSKNPFRKCDSRFLSLKHVGQDGSVDEQVYAGFSRRLMAFVFDICVSMLGGIFLLYPAASLLPSQWSISTVIFLHVLYVAYVITMTYRHGGTLGKILACIKICCPDGSALSLGQALVRNTPVLVFVLIEAVFFILVLITNPVIPLVFLCVAVPACIVWLLASTITLVRHEHSRTLHDYLANTIVVDEKYGRSTADNFTNPPLDSVLA
jgi:uncharacterized RDD family membrane protein YckC